MTEHSPASTDKRELLRQRLANKLTEQVPAEPAEEFRGVVIPIRAEGSRPLLVCLCGGGAGVPSYRKLAQLLPDQPIVGLQLQGLQTVNPATHSIERMAEKQFAALVAEYPQGPYRLCGHSISGVVALEVAQRLIRAGQEVQQLIIIDQPGPDIKMTFAHWFYWQWMAIKELPWRLRFQHIWNGVRFRIRISRLVPRVFRQLRLFNPAQPKQGKKASASEFRLRIVESSIDALRKYQPQVYPGRMALMRANSSAPRLHSDPHGGWKTISRGEIAVYEIPGDHMNVFDTPNIETLAKCVLTAFEQTAVQPTAESLPAVTSHL